MESSVRIGQFSVLIVTRNVTYKIPEFVVVLFLFGAISTKAVRKWQ
jgi:hypothetical protein